MRKLTVLLLAGILASLLASVASAGTARIDRRQAIQHHRIVEGRRHGQLTRREAMRLRRDQHHVRRAERRAGADGNYNRGERRRIEGMQDRQNRRIHRFRHNAHRV